MKIKKIISTAVIVIAGLIAGAENLSAQNSDRQNKNIPLFWINGGMGLGRSDSKATSGLLSFGINASTSNVLLKNDIISLRYTFHYEFDLCILCGDIDTPNEKVSDIGLLYGGIAKGKYGFASLSGGISVVSGVKRGELLYSVYDGGWLFSTTTNYYRAVNFLTVGIPLEMQVFLTPLRFVGIGLYGFANVNLEMPFTGFLVCLEIGNLRNNLINKKS